VNAKLQRPAVCNAMETLLVDEPVAAAFLPRIARRFAAKNVICHVDDATRAILNAGGGATPTPPRLQTASEADWFTEYNDYVVNVRVVAGVEEAIAHINHYGSAHSDSIVTRHEDRAHRFLAEVDSAAVYWNASTRFTDGGEFGLGAEIGISTDKVGARGPMGLEELTSYKWLGLGTGQVRT
jgi:glutamate-5-semialdehyde dehydrogenase